MATPMQLLLDEIVNAMQAYPTLFLGSNYREIIAPLPTNEKREYIDRKLK
jgi:hypothetical protein